MVICQIHQFFYPPKFPSMYMVFKGMNSVDFVVTLLFVKSSS